MSRSNVYRNLKEYSKAIQDCNKAIDLHPNDAANYGSRADIYIDLKEYSKAIQDHNKIIEIEPNSASNHFSRGVIYDGWLKEYSKAIQDYNNAIDLDPNYAAVYHQRGLLFYSLGLIEKACADCKKACELGKCDAWKLFRENGLCY